MTKEEFKARNTIAGELERRGYKVPSGRKFVLKCPFHQDKNPSFSVDNEQGLWNCHAGCGGGDIISLISRFDGISEGDVLKQYVTREWQAQARTRSEPPLRPTTEEETPEERTRLVIGKIYPYHDANGNEVYQVLRMVPKTFRQRHLRNNEWVWNMDGVERVLYRLPEVLKADRVWIVEGEKDADNLSELGYCATCNVSGAGKWLDSYSEALAEKEIVLCGDNDEPGLKHMEMVADSVASKAKNVRKMRIPGSLKDVSDFIATFQTHTEARAALDDLVSAAPVLIRGVHIPIFALWEIEDHYREHIRNLSNNQFNIGNWIPSLGRYVRGLVPGELITVVAGTGVGKTAILQNISKHTAPLPTVLFEMELPSELLYERFLGVQGGLSPARVEEAFREAIKNGERMGEEGVQRLRHVYVCTEARMTPQQLEAYILRSELKIGQRPKVVMIDYIQLMHGKGNSRYERASNVAEELKIIAKSTRVILFVASQAQRPDSDDPEIGLYDAKDSGSIENSSGLVLGAWRDPKDKTILWIKVLKNTKGEAGVKIPCQFHGESMKIVERATTTSFDSYRPKLAQKD